jgi:hypothetical protein
MNSPLITHVSNETDRKREREIALQRNDDAKLEAKEMESTPIEELGKWKREWFALRDLNSENPFTDSHFQDRQNRVVLTKKAGKGRSGKKVGTHTYGRQTSLKKVVSFFQTSEHHCTIHTP